MPPRQPCRHMTAVCSGLRGCHHRALRQRRPGGEQQAHLMRSPWGVWRPTVTRTWPGVPLQQRSFRAAYWGNRRAPHCIAAQVSAGSTRAVRTCCQLPRPRAAHTHPPVSHAHGRLATSTQAALDRHCRADRCQQCLHACGGADVVGTGGNAACSDQLGPAPQACRGVGTHWEQVALHKEVGLRGVAPLCTHRNEG